MATGFFRRLVSRRWFFCFCCLRRPVTYQPATSDYRDYRALEQTSLHVNLTRRQDLKISLNAAHANRPPRFIEKTDTTYRTGSEYRC